MFQQMRHMHGIPFDLGRDGATCVALALAVEGDVKSIERKQTTVNMDIDRRLHQSARGLKQDFYRFVTAPDESAKRSITQTQVPPPISWAGSSSSGPSGKPDDEPDLLQSNSTNGRKELCRSLGKVL